MKKGPDEIQSAIVECSLCNAISYVMSVAVAHYQIGKSDTRLKSIDKATTGAIELHDMILKEKQWARYKSYLSYVYINNRQYNFVCV